MRILPKYHIRWKLFWWGLAVVLASTLLTNWLAIPLFSLIDAPNSGAFLRWFQNLLAPLLYIIIASVLLGVTSQRMVNRVLVLCEASQQIAAGNFDIHLPDVDRHDEVYQLTQEFKAMAAGLQHNEYLRKDFISNVSHEIKTPLAVISGYADLLDDPTLSEEERRQYVDIIRRESRRLHQLSVNMLNISRLEHAGDDLERQQFRLDEQLRQVALLLEPNWSARDIGIDVDLPSLSYYGNQDLLQQVWVNLLDNAIKFSPPGATVNISAQRQGGMLAVTVADHGVGMDEATRARAFEQFYQGEPSHAGAGSGLGLPIVKRIVHLHHGYVTVDSAPGQGSRFTVCLPLNPPGAKKRGGRERGGRENQG